MWASALCSAGKAGGSVGRHCGVAVSGATFAARERNLSKGIGRSEQVDETKERIADFVKGRGKPVSIEEIAAGLLLAPDETYRAVLLLVQEQRLVTVAHTEATELELIPA